MLPFPLAKANRDSRAAWGFRIEQEGYKDPPAQELRKGGETVGSNNTFVKRDG